MTEQETPQVIGVRHVGLSARDPASLAGFYQDVLGLQLVPTDTSALGETAFLSSHPAEVPVELALFANPAYQHTAFEVRSLADLRAFHQRVIGRGVPIKVALNHGVSLSFYFEDPEGHLIELYWPTGVTSRPLHGDPIDLTRSVGALLREAAELAARASVPRPRRSGLDRSLADSEASGVERWGLADPGLDELHSSGGVSPFRLRDQDHPHQ